MDALPKLNIYRPILTAIDRSEMKRYAGIRNGQQFPEKIIDEAASLVLTLKSPQTVWSLYPYDCEKGVVGTDDKYIIASKSLRKHLANAEQVIFLAATVGEMVEEAASTAFARGDYTLGLLIDAAATAAVEQTADALETLLAGKFQGQGLKMTFRFSPGYGDWDLREQAKVVVLANAEAIGITLTDSLMLTPRKSITAIIGLCPDYMEETSAKGCQNCEKLDCEMRRDG